jgi:hypothetical protein
MNDIAELILLDETIKQVEKEILNKIRLPIPIIVDCRKQCGRFAIVTIPKNKIVWVAELPKKIKFEDFINDSDESV